MDDSKYKEEKHNEFSGFISKFISPYTTGLGKPLKRFMKKHSKRTIFKHTVHLNQAQSYLQEKISYPSANVEV